MNAFLPDLYGPIHKAAAAAIADCLTALGGRRPSDLQAWAKVENAWARLASMLDQHSFVEEIHLLPMLRVVDPVLAAEIDAGHADLSRRLREVHNAVVAVKLADCDDLSRAAQIDAYRTMAACIADYAVHGQIEQKRAETAIASRFAPAATFAAHSRLTVELAPQTRMLSLSVIARSWTLAPGDLAQSWLGSKVDWTAFSKATAAKLREATLAASAPILVVHTGTPRRRRSA
jgi:hypothetical protein